MRIVIEVRIIGLPGMMVLNEGYPPLEDGLAQVTIELTKREEAEDALRHSMFYPVLRTRKKIVGGTVAVFPGI